MNEQKHIKEISLKDLENAIEKAVTELTGTATKINITSFAQTPFDPSFASKLRGGNAFNISLELSSPKTRSTVDWDNDNPL